MGIIRKAVAPVSLTAGVLALAYFISGSPPASAPTRTDVVTRYSSDGTVTAVSEIELRWANRFYMGEGYERRDQQNAASWALGEYNKGYRIERHSRQFASIEHCEQAKARMQQDNPNLWWAECRGR